MRCVLCISCDPRCIPPLLDFLARRHHADMLLSAPPARTESCADVCAGSPAPRQDVPLHLMHESEFMAGIEPVESLHITAATPREHMQRFCSNRHTPVIGYLSYTYGMEQYGIAAREHSFPAGLLRRYQCVVTGCTRTGRLRLLADRHADSGLVDSLCRLLQAGSPEPPRPHTPVIAAGPLRQSLTREEYQEGVRQTQRHIAAGDTYQLNLSIRFDLPLATPPDTTALFLHLWLNRPAPFYALLHDGPLTIVSTSPERYLRISRGTVLTQPIKGTLAFDTWQPQLVHTLTSSPKERAELSMIVDLLRNDISTRCRFGSVRVTDHCSTFVVDRLIQMYSNVHGILRPDSTPLDLLLDAFPGGSVTGCPKLRTMQIIDRLEPHSRDLYCGSIFCFNGPDHLDASVAIRTGWHDARTGVFSWFAGSGLVTDSVPENEYAETMAKARKFQEALCP